MRIPTGSALQFGAIYKVAGPEETVNQVRDELARQVAEHNQANPQDLITLRLQSMGGYANATGSFSTLLAVTDEDVPAYDKAIGPYRAFQELARGLQEENIRQAGALRARMARIERLLDKFLEREFGTGAPAQADAHLPVFRRLVKQYAALAGELPAVQALVPESWRQFMDIAGRKSGRSLEAAQVLSDLQQDRFDIRTGQPGP